MLLGMIGQIKLSRDQFGCVFEVFIYVTKVFSESVAWRLPVSPMYNFLQRVQAMQ